MKTAMPIQADSGVLRQRLVQTAAGSAEQTAAGIDRFGRRVSEELITFKSDGLKLEGLLCRSNLASSRLSVVCHPHPLYGGSMYDGVVGAILEAMWTLECTTLRFNFRGVGDSEGDHDNGVGELHDAEAAVRFGTGQLGVQRDCVILAGYSFGALVAAGAAIGMPEVATVAVVAPPIVNDGLSRFADLKKRLVVVAGEQDRYCPSAQFDALRNMLVPLRLKVIRGTDHFFNGREPEVTAALVEALQGA